MEWIIQLNRFRSESKKVFFFRTLLNQALLCSSRFWHLRPYCSNELPPQLLGEFYSQAYAALCDLAAEMKMMTWAILRLQTSEQSWRVAIRKFWEQFLWRTVWTDEPFELASWLHSAICTWDSQVESFFWSKLVSKRREQRILRQDWLASAFIQTMRYTLAIPANLSRPISCFFFINEKQ